MHHCQAKSTSPKSQVLSLKDLNKRSEKCYKWHVAHVERQECDFLCLKGERVVEKKLKISQNTLNGIYLCQNLVGFSKTPQNLSKMDIIEE